MAGPLDGLVVVDASWGMPSGVASMMLADYGAHVIKVERPDANPVEGDNLRKIADRNKWSVTADLRTTEGTERLHRLLESADVFLESFGVGRADELGIGYENLRERYPSLVYVSLSGYSQDYPEDRPGYEGLLNARLGMMAEQVGHREGPIFLGQPTVTYGTAFMTVIGTLGALRARKLTGQGQLVSTSLLDGMLTLLSMNWWWNEKDISYLARSGTTTGFGSKRLITDPFECADGEYIIPHTGGPGSFKRMMDLMGFGDRIQHVDGPEMSVPLNDEELEVARDLVPQAFKTRPRDEWVKLFAEHDIACLPVLRPEQVFDDEQVQYAGIAADVADPDHGTVRQIGPVVHFGGTPAPTPAPAPAVGQHNDRIDQIEPSSTWQPAGTESPMGRALEGLRIVDFSSFFAAGFGAKLLGDLGADVVKVESLVGDQMRPLGDLWECSQRNKRGISVDVRTPEGRDIAQRLVAEADVVMLNFRPGKAEKLGLGYEQVKAINPNVIYADLPGFGSSGPKSELKSFAPLQSGFVGLNFVGAGEGNPPVRRVMGNEDLYNGFIGAVSVLMAVVSRQNSGEGQYVESPQLHSSLFSRTLLAADADGNPVFSRQLDSDQTGWSPLYRLYRTSDGWIAIAVVGDEKFGRLADALGHPEWATDPSFASEQARAANPAELASRLEGAFGELTSETAFVALDGSGVPAEIPAEDPVMPELLWEEWATDSGRVIEHHHPEYGWCREVGVTVGLSATPGEVQAASPLLGQHTRELLTELGYADDEVRALLENGVCRGPE